jgi:hypothetical protein
VVTVLPLIPVIFSHLLVLLMHNKFCAIMCGDT